MNEFDVWTASLSGVHLVEANAGTGKTWNIEGLVVRMLVEKRLEPKQVLVVTFTDAATQELRERILIRLNQVYEVLAEINPVGTDPFLTKCYQAYQSDARIIEHIELCKARFDEASIYTIHTFCKQVLTDFRFESGLETEINLLPDSALIQREVLTDEWRRLNQRFSSGVQQACADILLYHLKLDTLKNAFRSYSASDGVRMELNLEGTLERHPLLYHRWKGIAPSDRLLDYISMIDEAKGVWEQDSDVIKELLLQTDFSRYDYSKSMDKWEGSLTNFLAGPFTNQKDDHYLKFSTSFIQSVSIKKNGRQCRPDHVLFDLVQMLVDGQQWIIQHELRSASERMKEAYVQKRKRDQVLIFDDLLTFTEKALNPEHNAQKAVLLRNALRDQYPVALIDEFQDTDKEQFSIFNRIYIQDRTPQTTLYMIGDPKQSIYLFRGADLKTYFRARQAADSKSTLSRNFRSVDLYVKAVNAFFSGSHAFLDQDLGYTPSTAEKSDPGCMVAFESNSPLRFIELGEGTTKNAQRNASIYSWLISSISTLLSPEAIGSTATILDTKTGNWRSILPGDIAVLVSKHAEAQIVQQLLTGIGIPSVEAGNSSVFESDEARLLSLLLDVLQDPGRIRKVRALLTSHMFGMTRDDVRLIESDEVEWANLMDDFKHAASLAVQYGVLTGLRYLFEYRNIELNLAKAPFGERSITNVRHLSELLHAEEQEYLRSLSGLSAWLASKRASELEKSDEQKLRLESDEARVKIVTMHSSKGLQYPIVYAPFLWNSGTQTQNDIYYSVNAATNFEERTYDPDYYIDPGGKIRGKVDTLQDRIRLLYVSLTRAECRCYVPFVSSKSSIQSPLMIPIASLVFDEHQSLGERIALLMGSGDKKWENPTAIPADRLLSHAIEVSATTHAGLIHVERPTQIPQARPFTPAVPFTSLKSAEFSRNRRSNLLPSRHITSYSSIHRKYGLDDLIQLSERDEHELVAADLDNAAQQNNSIDPIFMFPRGALTGNYWHELFERLDFSDTVNHKSLIDELAHKHEFKDEEQIQLSKELVVNTLEASIGKESKFVHLYPEFSDLTLACLSQDQTNREMEFLYPYSADSLSNLMNLLHSKDDSNSTSAYTHIDTSTFTSLLTGLVDLIFEYGGKYFIVDYKSNHLGNTLDNYTSDALSKDIQKNGYHLQYHLYSAALVKYLAKRIDGFSYDDHFGGVFYLYWRGLRAGQSAGVFFDRPNRQVIRDLIEYDQEGRDKSAYPNIDKLPSGDGIRGAKK
jgi:exodeoxyribonuclease V beta subunit